MFQVLGTAVIKQAQSHPCDCDILVSVSLAISLDLWEIGTHLSKSLVSLKELCAFLAEGIKC